MRVAMVFIPRFQIRGFPVQVFKAAHKSTKRAAGIVPMSNFGCYQWVAHFVSKNAGFWRFATNTSNMASTLLRLSDMAFGSNTSLDWHGFRVPPVSSSSDLENWDLD